MPDKYPSQNMAQGSKKNGQQAQKPQPVQKKVGKAMKGEGGFSWEGDGDAGGDYEKRGKK